MCLEQNEEIVLKPNYLGSITLSLIPCDFEEYYFHDFEVDDECIADREQQKAYLDTNNAYEFRTYLYYNYETFESEKYNE